MREGSFHDKTTGGGTMTSPILMIFGMEVGPMELHYTLKFFGPRTYILGDMGVQSFGGSPKFRETPNFQKIISQKLLTIKGN